MEKPLALATLRRRRDVATWGGALVLLVGVGICFPIHLRKHRELKAAYVELVQLQSDVVLLEWKIGIAQMRIREAQAEIVNLRDQP
jgi:hypothetical protein